MCLEMVIKTPTLRFRPPSPHGACLGRWRKTALMGGVPDLARGAGAAAGWSRGRMASGVATCASPVAIRNFISLEERIN